MRLRICSGLVARHIVPRHLVPWHFMLVLVMLVLVMPSIPTNLGSIVTIKIIGQKTPTSSFRPARHLESGSL